MEGQTSCSEQAACNSQPSGRISKAAFKLFGKRRSGSSIPSIFSVRNKGDATSKDLIRSKTHDGLITDDLTELDGHGKKESANSERLSSAVVEGTSTPPVCNTITKSFSFFSLLRRNSTRISDRAATLGQRGRGLKGWFSSMRWRRKPPSWDSSAEIQDIAKETKGVDLILSCSSHSVDILEEHITLTLEPLSQVFTTLRSFDNPQTIKDNVSQELSDSSDGCGKSLSSVIQPDTVESSGTSLLEVQSGETLRAKLSSPDHPASLPAPGMTPPLEHSLVDPPSEDRLCSMFTDVTSLKSFDSLTGCGDIIADPDEDAGNGVSVTSSGTGSSSVSCGGLRVNGSVSERCSPAKPPLPPQVTGLIPISHYTSHQRACPPPKTPQGSGIVAYMGGGEEMASPEAVDDADMQGLWHMLPQKGIDSPALPRSDPTLNHLQTRQDKRPTQVKGLRLSKIPVSGCSKATKLPSTRPSPPPFDKDLQDIPPSDEGYWDSPTPGDEDSGFLQREGLPRESCSGDALYDLYDLDSPGTVGSEDDDTISPTPSMGELGITPTSPIPTAATSSSYRSIKGSTSLPRDSKIPINVRQKPPSHSSSQGTLSSSVSPTSTKPTTKIPAQSRKPVSKLPVRSPGNKNKKITQNRK